MSWTTSSPYPRRPFSRIIPADSTPIPTPTTASTEQPPSPPTPATSSSPPPLVGSPKPVPRSLTLSSGGSTKSRTPISPHKLAKLANALGVATPAPASVPYPLYSPTTSNAGSSLGNSSSTPSRYLIHVIPPVHLLLTPQDDPADPYERQQFRRGTLVSLHPTLNSQLGAIAREYSLPSIGGMVLYLISDNEAGPRITDDAWRMLWYRALQMDKDGSSNGKTIARFHSRSVTYSNNNSPYPSPSTTSESPHRSASPSNHGNASPSSLSMDLPINVHPGSALPIIAKVEFDIDRRKAPWYQKWKHRGRATSHSTTHSSQLLGGFNGSGSKKELQLPLRARSTSPSLADFKAKYTGTSASTSSAQISLNSPDESEQDGYIQLDDDVQPKRRKKKKMIHNGEFTDDPLDDVFPNDKATWAQIRGEHGQDEPGSPTSPHTPDVMIGGRIGDAIMRMDDDESGDESVDDDGEDVLTMWKEKHKRTLDTPGSPNSRPSTASRSRSASKHVPPPLDLSNSSKSQIPHVEIAPPTATLNSDLPYLGKNARGGMGGGAGSQEDMTAMNANGIQIVVEGTSASTSDEDGQLSAGLPRRGSTSTVGSEEVRSRRLDELERRIENLSPRSAWEDENGDDESHQIIDSPESTSPKMTPTISFNQGSEHDHNAQAEDSSSLPAETSASSLTVKTSKASRRQVSMGSFNSIPGVSDLAQALAAVPSPPLESPPLPPVPTEQNDGEEQSALAPPIDLASATPTPTTPGFPMSPDPFHRDNIFGKSMKVEIPPSALARGENGSPVSPPIRVSSRFSADSVTSDDGAKKNSINLRAERTGSIMSVKRIQNLWRKSGNSIKGQPLMSPGPNGQHIIPPTPPPFSDAPPLPISAGGFLSVSPRTPSQASFQLPPSPNPSATSFDMSTPSARASSSTPPPPPPQHRRSDSGLDPFHFDQESRYPVHKTPSPSQAFTDVVPPPALPESTTPPATATSSAFPANAQKKGILKAWGSKGSLKRTSSEIVQQQGSHPPSSFGSGKKARRPSASGGASPAPGHNGHSKSSSKASISSVGTNSKHSGSGTSHGSHGQGSISPAPSVPADPRPSLSTPSPLPGSSGRSSPAMSINTGHKSTGSNGSALTTTGSEGRRSTERKSTPPPPGALERAAAVAASREKRGTSYIGPADNRI